MDGSEVTDNNPVNEENPNPNPSRSADPVQNVTIPVQSLLELTTAINSVREELILQRTMGQNNNGDYPPAPAQSLPPPSNPQPNPPPPVRNIRNSSLN